MKIEHIRIANVKRGERAYCIGKVYINGKYSHDTIEDYDRGLDEAMTEQQIAKLKVMHKTAIPTGSYIVKMNTYSPTFGVKSYYKRFCKGRVPRLDPVKGYTGILIHRGVDESSSSGCVIVGYNKVVGEVVNSRGAFEELYKKMRTAADAGEQIDYIITRKYKA